MVSVSRPNLVKQVILDGTTVYVQRGREEVSDAEFDISRSYLPVRRRILCEPSRSRIPTGREILNFGRHHSKRRATT